MSILPTSPELSWEEEWREGFDRLPKEAEERRTESEVPGFLTANTLKAFPQANAVRERRVGGGLAGRTKSADDGVGVGEEDEAEEDEEERVGEDGVGDSVGQTEEESSGEEEEEEMGEGSGRTEFLEDMVGIEGVDGRARGSDEGREVENGRV